VSAVIVIKMIDGDITMPEDKITRLRQLKNAQLFKMIKGQLQQFSLQLQNTLRGLKAVEPFVRLETRQDYIYLALNRST